MNKRHWSAVAFAFVSGLLLAHVLRAQSSASSVPSVLVKQGKIDITLPQQPINLSTQELVECVQSAANAVTAYLGRFPVPHLTLRIRATDRDRGIHGVTYPNDGGLIVLSLGKSLTKKELYDDWTLTHEMLHLGFPSMERDHHWIEEGISVYAEPVARAQVDNISVDEVWRQFIRDMPQGEPEDGDQGLDNTHTWGRTYWGGAMFCLLADVQIRERTHNRMGLQDALRAILNQGGVISQDWEIERAFKIGDKATGTDVLEKLYDQMRDKPSSPDLPALWKKLGVSLNGTQVIYDDKAPDAKIRKAITTKKKD
jgi:hypothetical protein